MRMFRQYEMIPLSASKVITGLQYQGQISVLEPTGNRVTSSWSCLHPPVLRRCNLYPTNCKTPSLIYCHTQSPELTMNIGGRQKLHMKKKNNLLSQPYCRLTHTCISIVFRDESININYIIPNIYNRKLRSPSPIA